jgi:hypothetical protein
MASSRWRLGPEKAHHETDERPLELLRIRQPVQQVGQNYVAAMANVGLGTRLDWDIDDECL